VATAAYCSEVLERAFGPAALLRPGARLEFKGIRPVRAGDTITIGGHIAERTPSGVDCALEVHNQHAALVGVATARVLPEG
jgi:acyl dehydratase